MPVLNFKGKSAVYSHHLGVPFRSLEMDEKKSLINPSKNGKQENPSLDDNLVIHGDNLHVLKALLPKYAGKVKCIYIDPPYNTGNESWKYNDNVNSPVIKEWLGKVVGTDDLEKHDKWLCMMWPRLQLFKELLSDDGVIFVSIDDNEAHNLRIIMNEIFEQQNLIAQITAQTNPRGRSLRQDIARTHEYILVFSKNIEKTGVKEIPKPQKTLSEYKRKDKQGIYRPMRLMNGAIQFFNRKTRPNLFFPVYVHPKTGHVALLRSKSNNVEVLPVSSSGEEGCWTWSKDKIQNNPSMIFGEKKKTGSWRIYRKDYLPQNGQATTKERSVWLDKSINHEVGKELLSDIFQKNVFDYPKSHNLIEKCIQLVSDKNAIVLDSFAGSGTTAHAVLDLNKKDGGKRKFILVECESYANSITAERVRRVISGYKFKGTQKTTLMEKQINLSLLKNTKENLWGKVEEFKKKFKNQYTKIKEECKNGVFKLVGIKKTDKKTEGLGGSFTYCTLGREINEENLIKGKSLPGYKVLSSYVYYIATGQTMNKVKENEDFYIGKSDKNTGFFVIYKPSIKFLRSKESALNLDRAKRIKQILHMENLKKAVVFAPVHYFDSAGELAKEGIIFCQLPFAIYRMAGV